VAKIKPLISVAIPTYRREEVLIDAIYDVLNQSEKNLELLVIDQTIEHKPETTAALRAIKDPRFRYFKVSPPSVTTARNFAMQKANSPYIIFLDDDVKLHKDLVKSFLQTLQKMPEISAVAGRVMQEGFKELPVLQFDEYGVSHGGYTARKPAFTNAFPGGNCALVIKDALVAGGFDTRYRGNAFREENDLSMRMAKLGQKIYYQPKAEILHLAAPYGGHRVKTHIYDNPGFYVNEIFFTIRTVKRDKLYRSLRLKYHEYCRTVHGKQSLKRSLLFGFGLVRAICRLAFVGQRTARELTTKP